MERFVKRLYHPYKNLNVRERVDLYLAASKRGDQSEIDDLHYSCWNQHDLSAYRFYLLALERVAALFVIHLFAAQVLLEKQTGDPAPDQDLGSLHDRQTASWLGFLTWCQDKGHDPYLVLHLPPLTLTEDDPARDLLNELLAQLPTVNADELDAPADSEQVVIWQKLFSNAFKSAGHA